MSKFPRIAIRPLTKLLRLVRRPQHSNDRTEFIDPDLCIEVVLPTLGSMKRHVGDALWQPRQKEDDWTIRVGISNLHYRQREVAANSHVVLNNQEMAAIRNIAQTFSVSQPGVGWSGGVLADLGRKRSEAL